MFAQIKQFLRPKYLVDCYYKNGGMYLSRGDERFFTLGGAERRADDMNRAARWTSWHNASEASVFRYSAGHEDKEPGEA